MSDYTFKGQARSGSDCRLKGRTCRGARSHCRFMKSRMRAGVQGVISDLQIPRTVVQGAIADLRVACVDGFGEHLQI